MTRGIGIVGIVALVVATYVVAAQPWRQATAQGGREVTVEASTLIYEGAAGEECAPWGIIDTSLEVQPYRQVIVTDAAGTIVGVVDLQVGTVTADDGGQRTCTVSQVISLPDAAFYTFSVEGKYRRTVNGASLESVVAIHLPS